MKRSEFYAMFVTMIILFTASMSWAVSYQTQVIQPTKPYMTSSTFTADNSYQTILNISAKGILNRVTIGHDTPNSGSSDATYTLKITVDGVAYEGPALSDWNNPTQGPLGYYSYASFMYVFNGPVYFKTSLKIEAKASASNGEYTICYATE